MASIEISASGEAHLRCDTCGAIVCPVESGDFLGALAQEAEDHMCQRRSDGRGLLEPPPRG